MTNIKDLLKKRKNPDEDKEYTDKLRNHKINKVKKYVLILLAVLVVFIGIKVYMANKTYSEYEITENILAGDTTKCKFYEYGEYFLRYSDDGLACFYGSEMVWNQAFEMKQPIIDVCRGYVAIAEQRTNDIYIFNMDGTQGKVKTTYPILDIEVANQGVVAAITEEGALNHIEVIDKNGNLLAMGQTVIAGDGCPVDLSISEDGTKLIVSYLYVSGGVTQTRVVFYNYSEVGKNEVDRIVGGFNQYKTTIVPKVEFITNDVAVAFGDDMFTIYSIKQKPSILFETQLEKEVKSIFYSEEYIGFVFEPENLDMPYTMNIYDEEGKLIYEGKLDMEYKNIKIDGDNLLIYNEETLTVQGIKGKVKFNNTIEGGVNEILGLDSGYKYILVTNESIDAIKLK